MPPPPEPKGNSSSEPRDGSTPEGYEAASEERGARWRTPVIVVLVVVALGAWALVRSGSDSQTGGFGSGIIEQLPPGERSELPRITGRLLDGRDFDSRDLLGKVVVYNVWGSWCGPCRKEAPALRRVWEETRRQGVRFVGIDVKDSDASAIAFEREFGITYPSIRTADSASALLAFGSALASAVPSTVVVDRQGRAAARVVGPTTYATLKALVDDVLAEKEASQYLGYYES